MYVLVLLSACWCVSALKLEPAQFYSLEDAPQHFEDFMNKHGKIYVDEDEKAKRFEIFKDNLLKINELNKKSNHSAFGITKFADLSSEEFTKTYTGIKDGQTCPTILYDQDIPDNNAPESYDWRDNNAVTPVKNQGSCGSCFSFSSTGNVEGQYAIKHQDIIPLSEQQILDCGVSGCSGGLMSVSFMLLKDLGGAMAESDYPYEGTVGDCRSDKSKIRVKVTGCNSFSLTTQEKVKQLLYKNGPISIAVDGSGMQHATNGIIPDTTCTGTVNHAVLLVGYATADNNKPYWIIKNSWGTSAGDNGYHYMERSNNQEGACRMLNSMMASAIVE